MFREIQGQNRIIGYFEKVLATGRVSHAYLLCGEDDAKEALARSFAQALLCTSPVTADGRIDACGTCAACLKMQAEDHPDLKIIRHEKAQTISVEEIRPLRTEAQVKPYEGRYKIFMIPEADKMTPQAQNALLKTLEEPPGQTVLLLLASTPERFLPMVLSRTVLLRTDPSLMRREDAVLTDETKKLLLRLPDATSYDMTTFVKEQIPDADAAEGFLRIVYRWIRDIAVYKRTETDDNLISPEEIQYIRKSAAALSYEKIARIEAAIDTAARRLRARGNTELILELLLLRIRSCFYE